MAFYELRQYKVRPGKMAEWLKIMEEEIIPFQVARGMVITGSYRGETDDSVYVWMRRFESEGQREALYKAVYDSDHWKKEIAPRIPDLLDREECRDPHRPDDTLDGAVTGIAGQAATGAAVLKRRRIPAAFADLVDRVGAGGR